MADTYSLRMLGDPILTTPSVEVESLGQIDHVLINALRSTMARHLGVGMAAQQVGGLQRICVARIAHEVVVMINPRIVERSAETILHVGEGCLSVPGFRTSVQRSASVVVEWRDPTFVAHRETLTRFDAQVVQHECDHLDGHCIADGVSRQQRRAAERLVARARAAHA